MSGGNPSFITQVSRPGVTTQKVRNKNGDLEDVVVTVPSNQNNQRKPQRTGGLFAFLVCCQADTTLPENPPDQNNHEYNNNNNTELVRSSLSRQSVMQMIPPPFQGPWLLPPLRPQDQNKKCLVLDLDETLVHSSFKPVNNAHFVIPVEIENEIHKVYVLKRPGVDRFLTECAKLYEIIIFTASLSKYADPLMDILDPQRVTATRLFRESCVHYCGNYVKDLSRLGRDMRDIIIVDNSPHSYAFHPYNAVAIDSWFDDENDTQLDELHAFLVGLSTIENVTTILDATKGKQF